MAEFLSPEWIAALADAGAVATVPDDVRLVLQQVVLDDAREVTYALRLADGHMSVTPGRVDDANVTFTQDRDTAAAISAGTLSAQAAFLAGRLRLGGDLTEVLDAARALAELTDVFAAARGVG